MYAERSITNYFSLNLSSPLSPSDTICCFQYASSSYYGTWCGTLNGKQNATQEKNRKSYGQPAPNSHPHLLKTNEVAPGISKSEFKKRRFKLMESIAKRNISVENHLVVIPSATKLYMSNNIPYPFRQNTEFLYLSGFLEPDSVLENEHSELWDGPRSGINGSIELLGIDEAYNSEELSHFLQMFVKSTKNFALWYDMNAGLEHFVSNIMKDFLNENRHSDFNDPIPLVQNVRLIKSESEICLLKKSSEIASESMKNVMMASHPLATEAVLSAKMEYEVKIRGASYLAFPPVVAGGSRANIIHYIINNQRILPNEMILMDAGCEYHGYSSDMTRTWPVNGKFNPAQAELYESVLMIYKELLKDCFKFVPLNELFRKMIHLIGIKLQELGIISSNLSLNERKQIAFKHCPHHVSHYLGMDVHDTPHISRDIPLKPGMVITIEPGIYIPENCDYAPQKFRGLCVRIENDILITEKGPEVLTESCPMQLKEIEKLFGT
ncbi:Xaa-Pro aminopeptidase 3 [Nymphon striatum]|nr:Xaa-Pro aminopeptidase 3 [Nymphon striatum]